MDNESFKKILTEVGMTKKDFAEKVGLAYQTVAGWTNQGYPVWIDSYSEMMMETHLLKERIKSFTELLETRKNEALKQKEEQLSTMFAGHVDRVQKELDKMNKRISNEIEATKEDQSSK